MTNYFLKSLPPQSAAIYSYLCSGDPKTAKDLGKQLNVLPNAVYRAMKPLIELGLVDERDTYPTTYEALPVNNAIDIYSSTIRENFHEVFTFKKNVNNKQLDISFIHSREDLLEKTNEDIRKAKSAVKFIVSGLEVPSETILVYKQAVERGVTVNVLVQNLDETSRTMFRNWKRIGVDVKYYPDMETRIFIIDERIVFFTSYNQLKKAEAIGMRFNYYPYAKLMNEMFENRWNIAKEI